MVKVGITVSLTAHASSEQAWEGIHPRLISCLIPSMMRLRKHPEHIVEAGTCDSLKDSILLSVCTCTVEAVPRSRASSEAKGRIHMQDWLNG